MTWPIVKYVEKPSSIGSGYSGSTTRTTDSIDESAA
jgi:hypothetical protein